MIWMNALEQISENGRVRITMVLHVLLTSLSSDFHDRLIGLFHWIHKTLG